jgi:hypothetical protein
LAKELKAAGRILKVLYISGYADGLIQESETKRSAAFLQKPFTFDALAAKVREVLDA